MNDPLNRFSLQNETPLVMSDLFLISQIIPPDFDDDELMKKFQVDKTKDLKLHFPVNPLKFVIFIIGKCLWVILQ